jgi:flavin-dependent dehydrogenase
MSVDILIIGSGPAGSSTALHLAQLAPELIPHTLILEKAHHPRPKLCGGGLVIDAETILERLGLDVSEIPHVDAKSAHLDFEGRGMHVRLSRGHALRMIQRDEFDAWLVKNAESKGVEIKEGVTVKDVQPREECVIVETDAGDFAAQVVIGADGSNGVTRHCVLPQTPVHTARLLEVFTPVIARSDIVPEWEATKQSDDNRETAAPTPFARKDSQIRQEVAYFDFFPVPQGIAGYVWDFPTQVKGQAMRCRGVYDTNLLADCSRPPLKNPLAVEMARHGYDLDDYKLQGYPIRWFSPRSQFSAPRVLLVGDAAGVDPLFGEGISMALGYGQLAAQAIQEAFIKGDFFFRNYRHRILRSSMGAALTARWGIAQMLYHLHFRRFQRFFWRHMGGIILAAASIFVINWAKRSGD